MSHAKSAVQAILPCPATNSLYPLDDRDLTSDLDLTCEDELVSPSVFEDPDPGVFNLDGLA